MKRGNGHSVWGRGGAAFAGLLVTASLVLTVGATDARAVVVGAAPAWPIPAGAPAGPPPIPALPAAGSTAPPADQIADPVTAGATCGAWNLQSNYGGQWPATSTWWEYNCTSETAQYYPHPCPAVGACDAVCYGYPIDCYTVTQAWTDYFYWDGSSAVFYGELYSSSIDDANGYSDSSNAWWDAPTAQWYNLGPFTLTVARAGNGSGQVSSSPAGIDCGYTCQASYDAGTTITLTATPDASSVFTGWSGDCSGAGSCQLTMNQARSVTATFALKTLLVVSKPGFGSGQVSSNPAGIDCGASCQAAFTPGTVVSLTAIPDAGSTFTGWSGDCSGTGSCQVTMSQNHSVDAVFALAALPPTITGFSPTSGQSGQQVTITGTNLTGATSVKLGTTSAQFTVNSSTKITATVPTMPHGYYHWSITNPAGTTTSTGYFHIL